MKIRIFLALLGAFTLSAPAFAQRGEGPTDDYKKSWAGVATLKTLTKTEATRELSAVYPIFGGSRPVAQVAGLVLKQDAVRGFNGFEKESRGTAEQLGIRTPEMKYDFELTPTLILNRPRLIAVTSLFYQYMAGAHGIYGTTGFVFGYPAGAARPRQLHFADFFTDGTRSRARVGRLLMHKLRATAGTDAEASWTLDGTVKAVTPDQMENFVAEKDGLTWFFAPYAMGPYSSGEFEIKLTARELGPRFRAALLK